jgi:hypothetical protein
MSDVRRLALSPFRVAVLSECLDKRRTRARNPRLTLGHVDTKQYCDGAVTGNSGADRAPSVQPRRLPSRLWHSRESGCVRSESCANGCTPVRRLVAAMEGDTVRVSERRRQRKWPPAIDAVLLGYDSKDPCRNYSSLIVPCSPDRSGSYRRTFFEASTAVTTPSSRAAKQFRAYDRRQMSAPNKPTVRPSMHSCRATHREDATT